MVLVVRCDVDIFKLTASAQSIYRGVYNANANTYIIHAVPSEGPKPIITLLYIHVVCATTVT